MEEGSRLTSAHELDRSLSVDQPADDYSQSQPGSLNEAQRRLEAALGVADIATWTIDVATNTVWCDVNLPRLYFLDPHVIADGSRQPYYDAIHPDDLQRTKDDFADALTSKTFYSTEYRVKTPTGQYRWLMTRGRVERDCDGKAILVRGVVIDISDRKSVEEDLIRSETLFRTLADEMPQIVWTADPSGNALYFNRRCYEYTGMSPEEALGLGFVSAIHPDDQAQMVEAWNRAWHDGGRYELEYRIRHRSGQYRWYLGRGESVRDAVTGEVILWVGTCTDITEQYRHQEAEHARAEKDSALAKISAAVRSSSSPADVQAVAVSVLGAALGADRCYYASVDSTGEKAEVVCDYYTSELTSLAGTYNLAEVGTGFFEILKDRVPVFLHDGWDVDSCPWGEDTIKLLQTLGLRAMMIVPLYDSRELLSGVLVAAMSSRVRTWSDDDRQLAIEVANETRQAADAAFRLQRERNIARRLQDALIPQAPETFPGIALATYYRPALAEAEVGGDGIDVFELSSGQVALCLFDVSGKGLAAAQQVATVRNMLRFALYNSPSLVDAVSTLNKTLAENSLLDGFATLFVGLYDHRSQTFTYVNAGQEIGFFWHASTGDVDLLQPTGQALGVFMTSDYVESVIKIERNDVLAIYSDGMTEIGPNRRELLETDGLEALFRNAASLVNAESDPSGPGLDPHRIRDRFVDDATAYAGAVENLRDDIALLIVTSSSG